jgi:predicted nuclease with TOPRIM domain
MNRILIKIYKPNIFNFKKGHFKFLDKRLNKRYLNNNIKSESSDFEQAHKVCMCGEREKLEERINQLKKENSELNFMINDMHEEKIKKEKKEISELWGQTFAFAVLTTIIYLYGIPKLI